MIDGFRPLFMAVFDASHPLFKHHKLIPSIGKADEATKMENSSQPGVQNGTGGTFLSDPKWDLSHFGSLRNVPLSHFRTPAAPETMPTEL